MKVKVFAAGAAKILGFFRRWRGEKNTCQIFRPGDFRSVGGGSWGGGVRFLRSAKYHRDKLNRIPVHQVRG